MAGRSDHFALGNVEAKPEQLAFAFNQPAAGVSFLRQGARRFATKRGGSYSSEGLEGLQSDPQFQTKVAGAYQNAPVNTHRIQKAYRALADETRQQYDYLTQARTRGGLGVAVEYHPEDPEKPLYKEHHGVVKDILENRRLKVSKTGAATGDTAIDHPYLSPEENDMFRAVHDAFGHAAIGRSFSRHGEEAAYHSHAQMYSSKARRALAAETRGQNSALNYGKTPGVFPEQRAVDLPDWATRSRVPRRG